MAAEAVAAREEEHRLEIEKLREEHAAELKAKGAAMRALWTQQVQALREKEEEHNAALSAMRKEHDQQLCSTRPRSKSLDSAERGAVGEA